MYALTQLVAHIAWTIWFILMAVAGATSDQSLAGAVQPLSMYLLDVSCLTGPICLFFTRYGFYKVKGTCSCVALSHIPVAL